MKNQRVPFPLKYKLILFGGLLAVIPATAIGFGLMGINASTLETQNREMRLAVARELTSFLENSLSETEQTLRTGQQILTNPAVNVDDRIDIVTAMVEAQPNVENVAIYDKDGNYSAQIRQSGEPYAETPLPDNIRKVATLKRVAVTTPKEKRASQNVELTLAIRPKPDEIVGYMRARVPLDKAQQEIERIGAARLDPDSRIDILDTDGHIILSTHPEEVGDVFKETEGVLQDLPLIKEQGVAKSGEVPDRDVLVSAMPIQSLPWIAKVEIPLGVAYASLYRMRWIVAIGTTIAALIALFIAIAVANQIAQPLAAVAAFTQRLGARLFNERVYVHTNDEIEIVANSLNDAAAELQISEERIAEEIAIRNDLGRYLPSDLVDNIVRREADIALGGERRTVSVLFADIVRFTPLCENNDPEVVVALLNELFTLITTIIFETGGTVDKFIGDCVMAFWGAPNDDPDHAVNAISAAEKIIRLLEVGNSRWKETFGIEIQVAIGINTGEAVIGNIGSETRMEYTAIGNTVNEAARLEALARPGQILVTKEVVENADNLFDFAKVSEELLSVGGISQDVYEVL